MTKEEAWERYQESVRAIEIAQKCGAGVPLKLHQYSGACYWLWSWLSVGDSLALDHWVKVVERLEKEMFDGE